MITDLSKNFPVDTGGRSKSQRFARTALKKDGEMTGRSIFLSPASPANKIVHLNPLIKRVSRVGCQMGTRLVGGIPS